MRIPEIRQEIMEIGVNHGIPRLMELAQELTRRRPRQRAEPTSKTLTAADKQRIRAEYKKSPRPLHVIAQEEGVNLGRISETLRGHRK